MYELKTFGQGYGLREIPFTMMSFLFYFQNSEESSYTTFDTDCFKIYGVQKINEQTNNASYKRN